MKMRWQGMFRTAAAAATIVAIMLFAGCAEKMPYLPADSTGIAGELGVEAADTIGYGLGVMAAKNPRLQAKVEGYYKDIQAGGLTVAAANGILEAVKAEGDEYAFMVYKLNRILTRTGAKLADGKVLELAAIDPKLLEAGKEGYLMGYRLTRKK